MDGARDATVADGDEEDSNDGIVDGPVDGADVGLYEREGRSLGMDDGMSDGM